MRLPGLPWVVFALVSLLNAGCTISTLESRIHEKNAVFARITPRQQAMIKQGLIGSGFSRDMVYMALDKPDRIVPGPGPQQETWVYLKTETSGGSPLMPVKIVTHENGGSSAGQMPGSLHGGRSHTNTFTVEYDPQSSIIPTETTRRVQVIFLFGRVASIQIDHT